MTMDDTLRSMKSIVETVEPLCAQIASLHVMPPDLEHVRICSADAVASKGHQKVVRMNRRVKPGSNKKVSPSVTRLYPTPFGFFYYCKVDVQGGGDEVPDSETDDQSTVKQRTFRLFPSKVFRILGGEFVELRLAIHPGFDRINVSFATSQPFDSRLIKKALGICGKFWNESSITPDFPLLQELLSTGRIFADNNYNGETHLKASTSTIFLEYLC